MKAIALISGGLDSALAARLVKGQGIEVIGLKFNMPFSPNGKRTFPDFGIEVREVNIDDDFLQMLKSPRYGYGSNMNPCIDCKILMLTKAKELMQQCHASFIITGEVLGQRSMSQHKQALAIIAKRAGLEHLVLRPLSGKLLPETIPEKEGWVKREQLLGLNGRGRKAQIGLAESLGIKGYHQPAGGCLLTDPAFARRLKDSISHEGLNRDNIELLKIGRHFRISEKTKLVVGRNEKENQQLEHLAADGDYLFMPSDIAGPTALARGIFSEELLRLCCCITYRYCDLDGKRNAEIVYRRIPEGNNKTLDVVALKQDTLSDLMV